MTLVHLMRHGETEWNACRRLQGQADIALSEAGRAQVLAQRAALDGLAVHAVASDLARAVETARLLGFREARTDPRLREIHVGAWQGCPVDDLLRQDAAAYRDWRFGRHTPPGGESWAAFRARTAASLADHAAAADRQGRDLLLICHGGVVRALLDGCLGLPPERFAAAAPASLTTIRLDEQPVLVSYNRQSAVAAGEETTL